MMAFHWVDYVILLVLALSVLTGLVRGFIRETIALCVWISAIWVGFTYASELSPWLRTYIQDNVLRTTVGFILLLLATLLVGGLVSTALSFVFNRSPLRGTDRLLGMGFGFVRGVFIIALLIGVVNLTSFGKDASVKHSKMYAHFGPLSQWLFSFMPDVVHRVHGMHDKHESDTSREATTDENTEVKLID